MPTMTHPEATHHELLDHATSTIGPVVAPVPDLRSLVADLALRPLPTSPQAIASLRDVVRGAVRQLPRSHPLAGIEVEDDPAVALVRLLARLAADGVPGAGFEPARPLPGRGV